MTALLNNTRALSAGQYHTCGITTDGAAKCWGDNSHAQLGNDTYDDSSSPVQVSGLTSEVVQIDTGFEHSCAITQNAGLLCWGENLNGQLGDGTPLSPMVPVPVIGYGGGALSIATGGWHTCAVTLAGGAQCWGKNDLGQLGNDAMGVDNSSPSDVVGLTSGVQSVVAGESHACALTTTGAVKCWGDNNSGQLGNNSTFGSDTPVDVSGLSSGVQSIAAGAAHTCALLSSGGVKCWGANFYGGLGDNTVDQRTTPVDVAGLSSGVQAISAGGYQTCALLTDTTIKCWGRNHFGQIGDSTADDRLAPVHVVKIVPGP